MPKKTLLVSVTHGTYGHFDDARGAIIVASSFASRAGDVVMLFRQDGVRMLVSGQEPREVGAESLMSLLEPACEMGARIVAVEEDLKGRGIDSGRIPEWVEVVPGSDIAKIVAGCDIAVSF